MLERELHDSPGSLPDLAMHQHVQSSSLQRCLRRRKHPFALFGVIAVKHFARQIGARESRADGRLNMQQINPWGFSPPCQSIKKKIQGTLCESRTIDRQK